MVRDGVVVHVVALGEVPVGIGRAPTCELVISDEAVSWHHAQVWTEGGRVWVRDLGSRNGTLLDGAPVTRPCPVPPGGALQIGPHVRLEVRGGAAVGPRVLQVEDLDAGLRVPVRSDRFHIGSGPDAHLRLGAGAPRVATLLVHDSGELWVGTDTSEWSVALDEEFTVAGRRLRIVEAPLDHAPTVEHGVTRYPYEAIAVAQGPSGPQVTLAEAASRRSVLLTGNRGILLFLLARKLHEDRGRGSTGADEGWCSDADLCVGVWGRGKGDANKLHVLTYRLRAHLKKQGFDPWFIEKRHWGLRARLRSVELE